VGVAEVKWNRQCLKYCISVTRKGPGYSSLLLREELVVLTIINFICVHLVYLLSVHYTLVYR
jgi:hypothetical protein